MTEKYTNVILGNGQIANVISQVLNDQKFKIYDKGQWENLGVYPECDVFHVTIPYTGLFLDIINQAANLFQPHLLIVHSTVAPGTTEQIMTGNKLYSPVLGRHGDGFLRSVKSYMKFVAGDRRFFGIVEKIFDINVSYWGENIAELEYAKVMSTNRMYWELLFNKIIEKDCEKNNYSFEKVNNKWTENYNLGISTLNPKLQRAIYERMETDTPGGHCLRPNINLVDNAITRYLKAYEEGILYTVTKGKK